MKLPKRISRLIYICLCLTVASIACAAEVIVSVRAALGNSTETNATKPETQNAAKEFLSDLEGELMGLLFDQGHIAFNLPSVLGQQGLKLLEAPDILSMARASNADLMILCEIQLGGGQGGKILNGVAGRVSVVRMDGKTLGFKNAELANIASLGLADLIQRIRLTAEKLLAS